MRASHVLAVWTALLIAAVSPCATVQADALEDRFVSPDATAKPLVWWHWMNGNITRDGITADLESMKRVGIGGAHIFNVDGGIPAGGVKFMSPQWLDLVKFAAEEARRLDLELGIHNCPGWSSSGGPWNTPEHAMQTVFTSELRVPGGARFDASLPAPATPLGHFHDIAVLAFPTPRAEQQRMIDAAPAATLSTGESASAIIDGNVATTIQLPRPTGEAKPFVQLAFASPFPARELVLIPGSKSRAFSGEVQTSDDGVTFTRISAFSVAVEAERQTVAFKPVAARFYRVVITRGESIAKQINLAEMELTARATISNFLGKAFYDRTGEYAEEDPAVSAENIIGANSIVDLSDRLTTDGRLTWDAPPGDWTVARIGYAPNGRTNHPTPEGGQGLECDKLSADAVDAHWAGMMQPVIDKLGPLSGTTLKQVVLDSYEVGTQNWTPKFRQAFLQRRGYDPVKYLPVFTRRMVDSPAVTERFLWDLRRTIADLFAEQYAGRLSTIAHQNKLAFAIEPYGNSPSDDLQFGAVADVPMTEFWMVKQLDNCTKLAASAAHISGKPVVGSESFTAGELGGNRWETDLFDLKAVGDLIFAAGANRFSLHSFTHQPWLDKSPGMTMGACGTEFGRTNTWWAWSGPWVQYLTRCQSLLQSGRPVADVLYYAGEDVPAPMYGDGLHNPGLPDGYDFDGCDANTLLTQVSVKDNRLILPSGVSYRLLVLPRRTTMRPEILRKLQSLGNAGAVIVGPRPERAPGLTNYPACDDEVARLVAALWQDNGVRDEAPAAALARLKVSPDFQFAGPDARVACTHRQVADAEVYFVSNQRPAESTVDCSFRVSGKLPEFWDAQTGVMQPAPAYRVEGERTIVPMRFNPAGSMFVVFRRPTTGNQIVSLPGVAGEQKPAVALKIIKAEYCSLENKSLPAIDVTDRIRGMVRDNVLAVRVSKDLAPGATGSGIFGLHVTYEIGGRTQLAYAMQERMLEAPSAVDVPSPLPADCLSQHNGATVLQAWSNGERTVALAGGQHRQITVSGLPRPVAVDGPWKVGFASGLGAPPSTTFDRLTSWTDSSDIGIKYFSGEAAYDVDFTLPAGEPLASGNGVELDLGRVKHLARVVLNGRDLGILWMPPFRVDVTSALKPGENHLQVRVVNLWPNRLIGDEHLPADATWTGDHLKQWPDWLLGGKPSPAGRIAFTTRRHWTKDDSLLESGLLGPVLLRPYVCVPIDTKPLQDLPH